ncbi:MAG: Protein of unknown function (DUF3426) [Marinobacter excellens HL-55]|uniref:Zinc finger/thioredoxin putative domain-containing protein n=1 Tax=Marinobacter excellens HL-55 TaxID=1305731 RepID=A0A0P8BN21_9GAMM|nr:MAG: Protein of unknown function (DUF3426) [Marinobacter excellens HL-55]
MPQSSLQTQCPNCETRFRVTDEQLSIAGGKVRCGSCMKVFNAVEHQVAKATGSATADKTTPKAPDASGPAAGSLSSADEDEFVFADNPEEDAAEGRYAGTKLTFSEDELSDSFRGVNETEQSQYQDDDLAPGKHAVDESWAEAMLSDDQPRQAPEQPRASEPAPEQPKPAKDKRTEPGLDLTPPDDQPTPEPVEDTTADEPEPSAPQTEGALASASELTMAATDDDRPASAPEQRPRAEQSSDTLYRDLRRDPVSVNQGGSRLRTALWGLVVVALLGALVAQVTYFQLDRLSAIPQLRPFYEKGCELAGCDLKPLINIEAMQSRKLVVRTDPGNRSQLIVDAEIVNRAGFEQPFPAIALTFSNLNGDIVAQSTFTPEEYLAGDAEALDTMPSETPVRIAISIRDPGRDAVNYNLSFRPWEP